MRFVLKDRNDRYFQDIACGDVKTTCFVDQAKIFTLTVKDGEFEYSPRSPRGDWTVVPVRVTEF